MMWFLLLLLLLDTAHSERVITQDKNRLILMNGSNPCEGYIGIYHNSTLGYVGDELWSLDTEKVVCRSTHCDKPKARSTEYVVEPISKFWLNEVNCTGNESHLAQCTNPGWGVSYFRKQSLKKIECSNKINIKLDGFECAGAVQYSTDGGGAYSGYFCGDSGWGEKEATLLCKSLNCGKYKEIPERQWMVWKEFKGLKKMSINCLGIEDVTNLWQCATEEKPSCQNPASVICTDHEILQLSGNTSNVCSGRLQKDYNSIWTPVKNNKTSANVWCQKMHCGTNVSHSQDGNGMQLTCTDNVKVVLMDQGNTSKCYGAVYIEVNSSRLPVCASSWTEKEAKVVCGELNCGSVISVGTRPSITQQGIMDNVKCSGRESSLWHCRAMRDINLLPCGSHAYVNCAGSMDVRLMDSPGKCAGRVEIQHEGRWQRVNKKQWTDISSNVVCSLLGCGKNRISQEDPTRTEKFSQGSGEFLAKKLKCKKTSKHISQCIIDDSSVERGSENEAVGITCDGHKVVFLQGSCSGKVAIEHDSKSYWLSGSNETWNQETANIVCRQMQCGEASFITISNSSMMEDVWYESYSCSPNTTSLFDCKTREQPSDHNATIANVICSGKMKVNLTKECWGYVNVCIDGKCGGVCNDTWTTQQSVMLCKNLDCGDKILQVNIKPKEHEVIFKGLHSTKNMTSLDQCNSISFEAKDKTCNKNPAYVVCSGSAKARFSTSRDKCYGNVQVYNEGKWLPVCKKALKDVNAQNIICQELKCGPADKEIEYFGPKSAGDLVVSNIQCSGSQSLKACNMTFRKDQCPLGAIQCSSWSKMALTKACSGALFVHSQGKINLVSKEGWTEMEGERLCQGLGCGKLKYSTVKSNITTTQASDSTRFSCGTVENPENIWACEKNTSRLTTQDTLYVECEDEPKVTLSKECHGEVRINGIEVCDSHWKENYSHMVCHEQNCRNAVGGLFSVNLLKTDKQYHHVSCEDNHFQIGQCKRFMGKCDGNLVSVYCVGNVKFNTTEKCGGQIQVNYRDKWEKVCPLTRSFPTKLLETLCQMPGCEGYNINIPKTNKNELVSLETALNCNDDNNNMEYCVQSQTCYNVKAAEIYCHGYVVQGDTTVNPPTNPTVPIILGVAFILVLVILIVVFIRLCIVNKAKKVSKRMLSRKEVEFESGDYDDVIEKSNEMEDLSRASFREEAEVKSSSSNSYNDIDDVAEAQPLTGPAATAAAAGGNYINEVPLDRISDGATYEVDDPQENYDDIEAFPAITQTAAEVHDSPQATPESDAAAPLGLVEGGDDYLVPGQDG